MNSYPLRLLVMIITLVILVFLFGIDWESPETNNSTATSDSASRSIPLKSGIDLTGMDTSVRPQDDFFAYANGQWLDTTEIPADKSSWGSFNILHEKSLNQLQVIIEESSASRNEGNSRNNSRSDPEPSPKDSSTENAEDHASSETETNRAATVKIGAFYRSWLNEEELGQRQLSPIARELDFVTQTQSHHDIITLFAAYNSIGVDSPLNFWVGQDDKDSTRYTVFLTQSGLGLPDRDYYFDDSERGQEILNKYQDFIVEILSLADLPEPEQSAREIIALETRLAEHHWTKVDNRDSEKTYNPRSREQMQALLSQYNFDTFASGLGVGDEKQYIVRQPSYLEALNSLVADVDLKSWQNYLRFNILVSYAPYLNKPFEQAHFDFYNKTLSGQPQQQARWKLAISSINSNMGELLGQLYVAKHFPPQAKARMLELVDNLIAAYRASISELEWMSPETREKALAKLALFTPKIGYPDKWKDYSSLVIA
ncbi:MAG: M13 family metallopeptidase, partial [Porticoccaceae bacterium]|nr:M13 family metallopeptidase [Porticoccaceae bacterium]